MSVKEINNPEDLRFFSSWHLPGKQKELAITASGLSVAVLCLSTQLEYLMLSVS